MEVIFVAIGVLAILAIWYISTQNGFRRQSVKIDESLSGIDVALTKRYDTLTKVMDVAKGFAKHESELLSEVIRLRSGMSMSERNEAAEGIGRMADRVTVLAEAYPNMASSENFKQLQISAMDAEEHLQAARRLYNSNVSLFNQNIVSFPKSVVANQMGLSAREFFTAEEHKRQDVNLSF